MFRPDPRTLPVTPAVGVHAPIGEDFDTGPDEADEARTLLRLFGAAALAILALAVASAVIV